MSDDEIIRSWLRAHNSHGIVTLHQIDDTNPVQSAQIEGYQTEIRGGMQRHQQFGISTVPLPGSKGWMGRLLKKYLKHQPSSPVEWERRGVEGTVRPHPPSAPHTAKVVFRHA
jgi:hypothetical protein